MAYNEIVEGSKRQKAARQMDRRGKGERRKRPVSGPYACVKGGECDCIPDEGIDWAVLPDQSTKVVPQVYPVL